MLSSVVQVWSIEEFRKAQDEISDLLMENSNDNLAHTLAGGRVAFPPFAEILPALSGYDGGCLRLSAACVVALCNTHVRPHRGRSTPEQGGSWLKLEGAHLHVLIRFLGQVRQCSSTHEHHQRVVAQEVRGGFILPPCSLLIDRSPSLPQPVSPHSLSGSIVPSMSGLLW